MGESNPYKKVNLVVKKYTVDFKKDGKEVVTQMFALKKELSIKMGGKFAIYFDQMRDYSKMLGCLGDGHKWGSVRKFFH